MSIEVQEALANVQTRLYIGGEWTDAEEGGTFSSVNPATGETIAELQSATAVDLDRAVASAREAFAGVWAGTRARKRGRLLWKLGEALRANVEEVALLETLDNGKPIFESRYVDIPTCADILQYYAGWADKVHGETISVNAAALDYTLREPLGVVGAIVPWNFPLLLAVWKLGPDSRWATPSCSSPHRKLRSRR